MARRALAGRSAEGQDVEHPPQSVGDLCLLAKRLADLVCLELFAGGPHLPGRRQAAQFLDGVGDALRGGGIILPRAPRGGLPFLFEPIQPAAQVELPLGLRVQVGQLPRRQVLEVLGQCTAGKVGRLPGQVLLIPEQLLEVAAKAAAVVRSTQPAEHRLQDHNDLILTPGGGSERGRGVSCRLGRLDRGRQIAADRRQLFAAEAVKLTEQFVHAKTEVRTVNPVVLQVGQQREDVHGEAVVAVGQSAVDLALGKFGGLEAVQIDLLQPPQAIQASVCRRDVRPGVALHGQQPGQLGAESAPRGPRRAAEALLA